jgi:hypothetical protein
MDFFGSEKLRGADFNRPISASLERLEKITTG